MEVDNVHQRTGYAAGEISRKAQAGIHRPRQDRQWVADARCRLGVQERRARAFGEAQHVAGRQLGRNVYPAPAASDGRDARSVKKSGPAFAPGLSLFSRLLRTGSRGMAFGITNATGYFLLRVGAAADESFKLGVGLFFELDELLNAHQLILHYKITSFQIVNASW